MKKIAVVALALVLAACSEPRIDTSSDEAAKTSIQSVRKSLNSDDRAALDGFVAQASASVMLSTMMGGGVSLASILEPLDGMTGAEAAAYARQLGQENDEALKRLKEASEEHRAALETLRHKTDVK